MRSPKNASFGALVLTIALVPACQDKVAEPEPPPKPTTSAAPAAPDPTELKIEDLTPGEGERAVKDGDEIKVLYVGRLLKTNAKFDSNDKRDAPFKFTVGEGVIEGWSKGVVGMKKGGKRKLTIPASLAYKEKGSPPKIPPNAPLVFEIELLGWADEPAAPAGSASAAASGSAGAAPSAKAAPTSSAAAAPKKEPKKEEPKK
jgi:hypothetical protein